MDSPPEAFDRAATTPPRRVRPLGTGPIAALFLGGVPYVFTLFLVPGLSALMAAPEAAHTGAAYDPSPAAPTFFAASLVLVCAGLPLWPLFRYVGLPRPAATLGLLVATVGVVHLQSFVTAFLFGFDHTVLGALSVSPWVALAFTALAVPITLAWNRGHGFRRVAVLIVAVVLLRALVDWNSYTREDEVVRTVSEHPREVVSAEARHGCVT